MGRSMLDCRLVRSDHRIRASWSALMDPYDGKQMREALIGAVKADLDDPGEWEDRLHLHVLQWRWGPSNGWRSFRAAS